MLRYYKISRKKVMQLSLGTVLRGKDLEEFLLNGIGEKKNAVIEHLSLYDSNDLFPQWIEFIRQIDELINLLFDLSEEDLFLLADCKIDTFDNHEQVANVFRMLQAKYGEHVAARVKRLVAMYAALKLEFCVFGIHGLWYRTIFDIIGFCQSRRLYYMAYLSLIRLYAKGEKKIEATELLSHFQEQIETNMTPITTGLHGIMGSRCLDGYQAVARPIGLQFNMHYQQLEGFFLEAHTMSELDILEYSRSLSERYSSSGVVKKLYSYAELENAVKQAECLFGEYGIVNSTELLEIKQIVSELKAMFVEEYSLVLDEGEYKKLAEHCPHLQLCSTAKDYYDTINERPAFYPFADNYYSTVFMMIRYVENTLYGLLKKKRRYRIKAGFMFEKKVEALLKKYRFEVTDVKRIHMQEFDVICKKGDTIYNFQCKNNYLDINNLSPVNMDKVCKQNKRLTNYYIKALEKENHRTRLLVEKFKTDNIENYVVVRYPVMMDHSRVICYNNLEDWLESKMDR